MKTRLLLSILTVMVSLQLFAQEDDQTECPYFSIIGSDTTGVSFGLFSTEVDAEISGVIANVDVTQTYINDGDSVISASYVFPMSTRAAIYGMEMHIDDRHIIAEIRRNEEAQELFDQAEEDGLTASLLEQERPNVFQMSLANILPGDTLQVIMSYTEMLVPEGGEYKFVFPTVVGPRFTTESEPWVLQSLQDAASVEATVLALNLTINGGMPVEASSPSHPADFTSTGNTTETSILTQPGSDIEIDFNLAGNEIETGMLRFESEEENFFVSIIQPPNPDISYEGPKRDYVFIMDVSGSMNGYPIEVSKQLISDLLGDLNFDDKFNIMFFAGGSATFAPNSVDVTAENIELALDMIDQMSAGGSTQLLPALTEALDMTGTEGYSRTFVILTDGFVTVESQAFQLIRENLKEANFFSFGIGGNPNHHIIEGIAYVGEGESFIASDEADAYEVADQFRSYIESPVLTNIEASFEGVDVYDVEPLTIPDVFAERPIVIYGKYENEMEGEITLTGDYGNTEISSTLSFADFEGDLSENEALKYLWARKRIKLMSDYGVASNENDTISIEEEITLLGLQYSLITDYTSLIAIDSTALAQDIPDGSIDDDGEILGLDELVFDQKVENENIIQLLGNVLMPGQDLRAVVDGLGLAEFDFLTIQITSLNGSVIAEHRIDQSQFGEELKLAINAPSAGVYVISVHSTTLILDSDRFVVK